jgi:hypothetical protein
LLVEQSEHCSHIHQVPVQVLSPRLGVGCVGLSRVVAGLTVLHSKPALQYSPLAQWKSAWQV